MTSVPRLVLRAVPLTALAVALVVGSRWWRELRAPLPAWEAPELSVTVTEPRTALGDEVLEGRLVEQDGQPAGGVSIVTVQGERVRRAITESDGRFQLARLLPGPATLHAVGISRLPESFDVDLPAQALELQLEGVVVRPEPLPSLERADLSIELLLPAIDDLGSEGLRLALVPVGGPAGGVRTPRLVEVPSSLRIELPGLPLGAWEAQLLPPGCTLGQDWDLLRGQGETAVVLEHAEAGTQQLRARHGLVGGRLVGQEGRPAANALVVLGPVEDDAPPLAAVHSDAEGRWSVGRVPAGAWRIDWRDGSEGGRVRVTVPPGGRVEVAPDAYSDGSTIGD